MTDIVLDLETADARPGAAILSIGAVAHRPGVPLDEMEEFYRTIDLETCQAAGLSIGSPTLMWWFSQDFAVRAEAFSGEHSLQFVLHEFARWLKSVESRGGIEIYGKGPSFDCAILAAAYNATGQKAPWDYRQERCLRTMVAEAERILGEDGKAELIAKPEVPHHALHDARAEMTTLINIRWAITRRIEALAS